MAHHPFDIEAVTRDPLLEGSRPGDSLLTTAEAARRLRLSPRTLERLRMSGQGPRFLKAGPGKRARVFYLTSDLAAWIGQFRFGSTSEYSGPNGSQSGGSYGTGS